MNITLFYRTRLWVFLIGTLFFLLSSGSAFATGSLTVTIAPQAAVDDSAQWSVDSGSSWHNSGDTVSGLTAGDVTLQFNAITGWRSPSSQTVTIVDSQTSDAVGIYLDTSLTNTESFGAGNFFSIVVKSDGSVWTWGRNEYGQLGDGTIGDHNGKRIPVPVLNSDGSAFSGAIYAGGGNSHAAALKSDGTVWTWGANDNKQRGDGTYLNVTVPNPVQVLAAYQTPFTGAAAVFVGQEHTLAIKSDGTLRAWGDNYYGQLGDGTTTDRYFAVQVNNSDSSAFTDVAAVAAGQGHTVALRSDGTVWAWGNNNMGQLGEGQSCGTSSCANPVQVKNTDSSAFTGVIAVAVGYQHTVALKADGTLWAWGGNFFGELGDGQACSDYRCTNPVKVVNSDTSDFTGVTSIASSRGDGFSVAMKTDGTVWAWGLNDNGQLGDGTTTNRFNPVQVKADASTNFTSVSAIGNSMGAQHAIAQKADGSLWTWGGDYYGQLGNGGSGGHAYNFDAGIDQPYPVQVQWTGSLAVTLSPAAAVTAGAQWRVDSGAWNNSGDTVAGLSGGFHTLEFSTVTDWRSPLTQKALVSDLSSSAVGIYLSQTAMESVKGGGQHTSALRHDGSVWSWGYNGQGQLGDGWACGTGNCVSPVQVVNADTSAFTGTVAIDTGAQGSHVFAVKSDGTAWAWGYNLAGKLGDGTTTNRPNPVQVRNGDTSEFTDVVALSVGESHSLALKSDGTVWAWGTNFDGELGIGTSGSGSNWKNPLQVKNSDGSFLNNVTGIAAGGKHSVVVKADGTVWAWGYNQFGQTGDGTSGSMDKLYPVQAKNADTSAFTGAVAVETGRYHSIALKSDGTVWVWGAGTSGQIGDGYTLSRSNPKQVTNADTTPFTGAAAISAGHEHTVALKSDGTVWAWGNNVQGVLGDGQTCSTGICTRPTQVRYSGGSAFTDASHVASGSGHIAAAQSNGAVWAWGYNNNGQIGDGTSGAGTNKINPALSGGFTIHNGSLKVTIEPQAARDAGAQWRVDGGAWQDSGSIVAGLTPGSHTVEFSVVSGANTPSNQPVTIIDGQITNASGTYSFIADLSITKTDGQATEVPGTAITYTIVVTNNGPADVTGTTVTDAFPGTLTGASWTCTASSGSSCSASGSGSISDSSVDLLSGGTATYTVNATISSSATGTLENTASVAAPAGITDNDTNNNSATDTDTLTPQVDILVTKTESADPVVAGSGSGNLTYTVTATNNGPSDATGIVVSEDLTVPAGVTVDTVTPSAGTTFVNTAAPDGTWTVGSLASGAGATLTVVLTVGSSAATGTDTIANTATLSAVNETDTNGGNDSVTVSTSICADMFYRDADGDGFGDPADTVQACTAPAGYVAVNTDCDDTDPEQKPGQNWYADVDQDGYGDKSGSPETVCLKPSGKLTDNTDCDDSDSTVNPGKREGPKGAAVCSDAKDNDCDGNADLTDRGCTASGLPWLPVLLD